MVKITTRILALMALYAFTSAAVLEPKADTDLGPSDFVCPEGYYVYPHETQCELYYICASGGTPTHLYHCYSDYLFDLIFYGCNFKELVDCGDRLKPFTCPSPDGKFPVSPDACDGRYYICDNDEYTLETCPNGNIFDASTGTCSSSIVCPTTTMPTTKGTPGPFECPAPNGNFPSPYTCTQFYTCIENVPILNDCPSGLYYNPAIEQCDWPYNVPECTGRKLGRK